MSEISSGLVAVAWIAPDEDRFRVRICEDRPTDAPLWSPMCWVSDAEAIIAQKDAEILDQCRLNGIGAERELALRGQIERQDERIKGLEEQAQSLARSVMCDQVSNDSHSLFLAAIRDLAAINECLGLDPDDGGAVPIIDAIEAQSAALKLAREALIGALSDDQPYINASKEALAAINEVIGE